MVQEGKVKQRCRLRKKREKRREGGEHNDRSDLSAARETSVLVLPLFCLQTPNHPPPLPGCRRQTGGDVHLCRVSLCVCMNAYLCVVSLLIVALCVCVRASACSAVCLSVAALCLSGPQVWNVCSTVALTRFQSGN